MKISIPTLLAFSVLLGLTLFFLSTKVLISSLKQKSDPVVVKQLIIKKDSLTVRIYPKVIVHNVPIINTGAKNNETQLYLNVFPATLNWIMFHSIILSAAFVSLLFFLLLILELKKEFDIKIFSKVSKNLFFPSIIVLIAIVSLILWTSNYSNNHAVFGGDIMAYFEIVFENPKTIVKGVEVLFIIIGVCPLFGIMIINLAANKYFNKPSKKTEDHKLKYKRLKDSLTIFAFFAGILVATSIIGTNLQREMIVEQVIGAESIYPDAFIFGYGITFSFMLALFFLPSLIYLKHFKKRLNIKIEDDDPNTGWWQIGQESADDFKLIFSLVIPILSTMVQSFLM